MSASVLLLVIVLYFGALLLISRIQSRKLQFNDFYNAGKRAPWAVVAFGMIGASLSGVTFISVPGWVGERSLSYMQMVFGYFLGYLIIAGILLPIYYRMGLQSIYEFLDARLGRNGHLTGAAFFLISRSIGAAFRLYLVAIVLQRFVFEAYGVPFYITVGVTIVLIWLYTFRSGIKTIIWTDTLQTASMLLVLVFAFYKIGSSLDLDIFSWPQEVINSDYGQVFFFENGWSDPYNFFKQILSGMFITIVMTGLDQDMMQKNLSCRSLRDARKNMISFSLLLILINFLFLSLGVLLYLYMQKNGIDIPTQVVGGEERVMTDLIFPTIAVEHFGGFVGLFFFVGLIAAAYSSADSALTSLTTSFCVDILKLNPNQLGTASARRVRTLTHIGFSIILFVIVCAFWWINDRAVIGALFTMAGYTYGPLLGMFVYGLWIRRPLKQKWLPVVAVSSPILSYILQANSEAWLNGYIFDFELLIVNGLFCFLGMIMIQEKSNA